MSGDAPALRGARAPKHRGRPRDPSSQRSLHAKLTVEHGHGYSRRTAYRLERHVALAERYPFMRVPDDAWTCRMATRFGTLPHDEWDAAAALFEDVPTATARLMLENLLPLRRSERWRRYDIPTAEARASLTVPPSRVERALGHAAHLLRRVARETVPADVHALVSASLRDVTAALAAVHGRHDEGAEQ